MTKSPFVAHNAKKQLIRCLDLDAPALGVNVNGGNTVSDTHRVLKIIKDAQEETGNFDEGGWEEALKASF